jgi:hypothetical protein
MRRYGHLVARRSAFRTVGILFPYFSDANNSIFLFNMVKSTPNFDYIAHKLPQAIFATLLTWRDFPHPRLIIPIPYFSNPS